MESQVSVSRENPFDGVPRLDSKDVQRYAARLVEWHGLKLDAAQTFAFARELEYVIAELFEVEYPEHKATALIPVDTRIPSGAETFTYRMIDKVGRARIVHNYAADAPTAEIQGQETPQRIVSLAASYVYSIQDMRAAALTQRPLDTLKANAARYAVENLLEDLSAYGDTNTGLYGLANAPSVNTFTSATAGSTWRAQYAAALAAGDIQPFVRAVLADLNGMAKKVFDVTLGVHEVDTVVLPTAAYSLLASTPVSTANAFNSKSLLQFVLEQSPWLKTIEHWNRLNDASKFGGTANHGRAVAYKKDPKVLGLIISQPFEQFAPQPVNLGFKVPTHMRTGAVEVRYPKAACYLDDITDASG